MADTVKIERLAYGGSGVGHLNDKSGEGYGKVAFVPFSHPGDLLSVNIKTKKKRFVEAEIVEILEPSPERVLPVCDVFTRCGGCSFQHVSYETQLEWKRLIFEDAIKRIGKLSIPEIEG
ncbi:MAG: TRAM domain-containing protein, partial [bacterium]|nr:TRAM domain-containing protein [bacterium]